MAVEDAGPIPVGVVGAKAFSRLERKVDHVIEAVFGNPLDDEDHGLSGEMRETRRMVSSKLDRLYHSVLALAGTLIVVCVTLAVALH